MTEEKWISADEACAEPERNQSDNRYIGDVIDARYGRRDVIKGGATAGAAVAAAGVFSSTAQAHGYGYGGGYGHPRKDPLPELNFDAIPTSDGAEVVVPQGYTAKPFIPWGTPICGDYPAFMQGHNTADEQAQQTGMHHDGMYYFPMGRSHHGRQHGMLCINHENITQSALHPTGPGRNGDGTRNDSEKVRKEIAAHGVAVIEIKKEPWGDWEVVRGRFNRRVTGGSPMSLTGPVAGSDLVKTKYSPNGTQSRGTLNNCANGNTPWDTYLTCEENWAGYFYNLDAELPREHSRYGVRNRVGGYAWGSIGELDETKRFNASSSGASATDDYRNEPNTMGWVVEIDPFDPRHAPKKRTAMGRFGHECASLAPVKEGEPVVAYMGDDSRFEYVYKFVSKGRYSSYRKHHNRNLLEEGTLYVATFNEDGSGNWTALVYGQNGLTPENGFNSQAEVLVNTRLAADLVGATPMDRPEWSTVHPKSRMVYITMTNNTRRGADDTNAPNPRGPNPYGHIIRWQEKGSRPWATSFDWDIFALAGPEGEGTVLTEDGYKPLTDAENTFSSPDGLWFDDSGILWIETDGNRVGGHDMVLACIPETGEIRRFMTGVPGSEMTGICMTPDRTTLFANVQHPGGNWPEGGSNPPRSATMVVSKDDHGVVGGEVDRRGHGGWGHGWGHGWGWGGWGRR